MNFLVEITYKMFVTVKADNFDEAEDKAAMIEWDWENASQQETIVSQLDGNRN